MGSLTLERRQVVLTYDPDRFTGHHITWWIYAHRPWCRRGCPQTLAVLHGIMDGIPGNNR